MKKDRYKKALERIEQLNILNELSEYNPTLCGTLPIGVDTENSDLDIIMEVKDLEAFREEIEYLYSSYELFRVKEKVIRGCKVVKANFRYGGFEFELFGQNRPVQEQYAYLHMIIEKEILNQQPSLTQRIKSLKEEGYKTEPAFCKVLELPGDPYEALIQYGIDCSII
ncbi:DUF4269 domain-containing protein [Piscibacillus sp. B03]|uniref:DUF4269 domain-containing protein n=1 Tax=Piscibacillus sp. B03 TaxID=3457430 RepID=UPI003FCCAD39